MIEKKRVHPTLEAIGTLYEFAMQQLGYTDGSMRVEDGKLRDIDTFDAYGTRCFSTMMNGEFMTLVEKFEEE